MANNKPTETIRDGLLKATVWRNETDKTVFYSVNFSRSYQDDKRSWKDTDSFSGTDLLRIANLATQAYNRTVELRQMDREASPQNGS